MQIVKEVRGHEARRRLQVLGSKPDMGSPKRRTPRQRPLRTALVNMPFVSTVRPSIQLGLLKAIGQKHGFAIDTYHLNLDLCARLGKKSYEALCHHRGRMFGDWLFSLSAFEEDAPDPDGALAGKFEDEFRSLRKAAGFAEGELERLRHELVPRFLSELRDGVSWRDYDVIGFTSTFQQTVAAAALAREIRSIHPEVCIVFGGANLDGDMGKAVVAALPVIDYGVSGEADTAFPALLRAIDHGDPKQVPGVVWRKEGEVFATPPAAPLTSMDDLPTPDYEEYFERAKHLDLLPPSGSRGVMLPFESSRGCWWGAKSHCTFCGLNGATMKYRSKSPERVLDELAAMSQRYRTFRFEAVDNIMDHRYVKTLLPRLAEGDTSYSLFYEIKSNVGREELRSMHQAGIVSVQPGIESLSSQVLRLMRKGVKASQNVNLMRWGRYYGIGVAWNLIYGFPGERLEDYERQAALLPLLVHLDPPSGCGPVWLERFSPLFREREKFPARRIAPEASYRYVYPSDTKLDDMAYFFDFELEDTLVGTDLGFVADRVAHWRSLWEPGKPRPRMTFFRSGDFLQIDDARNPEKVVTHTFEGPLARLYHALSDGPQTVLQLARKLELGHSAEALTEALNEFCTRGLMMEDEGAYLSLALPAGAPR